ncbi:MAG TPA: glycosyltransferase [Verrucomicrobiae bacterium]|nr:glycosyltransferase [Verrucomicrobiae bacterium]
MSGIAPVLPSEGPGSPALVVVISQFPDPNETFIVREITELRRRGLAVIILSLRPPPPRILDPEARALLPLVVYPPGGVAAVLREAWRTVRRAPRAALRAIAAGLSDVAAALPTPVLAGKQAALLPLALAYGGRLPAARCRLHAQFANVPTAVVRVLAALRGGTYSFTAHAWDIFVPENRRLLPARIAGADLVVTCTAYNRTVLTSLAPSPADADKVVLCHHGLDLSAYTPGGVRAADLIVGGMSLVEQKGLTHLVAACARLRDRGLRVRCVLIGEGPERPRLEAQIRSLGLAAQVRLTGQVPHSEVVRWLRDAAVFAHPSIAERRGAMDGIPNAILEALALETPVVGTRLSGIPEVVLPEQTGLLVEPGDEEGLATALARLLADPPLGRRLGAAGRALVLERFDLRRNVEPLAALLAAPNAGEAPVTRAPAAAS